MSDNPPRSGLSDGWVAPTAGLGKPKLCPQVDLGCYRLTHRQFLVLWDPPCLPSRPWLMSSRAGSKAWSCAPSEAKLPASV